MAHVEPPRHDGLPHPDLTSSLLIEVAADPDGQGKHLSCLTEIQL